MSSNQNEIRDFQFEEVRDERRRQRVAKEGVPLDLIGEPGRLLTTAQAAGYLAISRATLFIWVHNGRIPYVRMGPREYKFLLSDLDEAILRQRHHAQIWAANDKELPREIVARLLGYSAAAVSIKKREKRLKDYSPESIREVMLAQARNQVRPAMRKVYETRVNFYRTKYTRLKAKYENR